MRGWIVWLAACSYSPARTAGEVEIDAPAIDAPLVCNPRYDLVLPGSSSRYYVETDNRNWRDAEAGCEQTNGHLFAPTSDAEVEAMRAMVGDPKRWVGLIQQLGQTQPTTGWFSVTGGPAILVWEAGKPDDGGNENNGEQAGVLGNNGLDDENHTSTRQSICECDGKEPDASVIALLPL
jgi:hypothetical protein